MAAPPQFLKKGRAWRRRLGPPDGGGLCKKGRRAFGPRVVDSPAGNAYNAYMVSVTGISSLCFSHPWLGGEISHLRWLSPFWCLRHQKGCISLARKGGCMVVFTSSLAHQLTSLLNLFYPNWRRSRPPSFTIYNSPFTISSGRSPFPIPESPVPSPHCLTVPLSHCLTVPLTTPLPKIY